MDKWSFVFPEDLKLTKEEAIEFYKCQTIRMCHL